LRNATGKAVLAGKPVVYISNAMSGQRESWHTAHINFGHSNFIQPCKFGDVGKARRKIASQAIVASGPECEVLEVVEARYCCAMQLQRSEHVVQSACNGRRNCIQVLQTGEIIDAGRNASTQLVVEQSSAHNTIRSISGSISGSHSESLHATVPLHTDD
jgi:hypothetical protein